MIETSRLYNFNKKIDSELPVPVKVDTDNLSLVNNFFDVFNVDDLHEKDSFFIRNFFVFNRVSILEFINFIRSSSLYIFSFMNLLACIFVHTHSLQCA